MTEKKPSGEPSLGFQWTMIIFAVLLAGYVFYHAAMTAVFPYDLIHAFEGNNVYAGWRVSEGLSPYEAYQADYTVTYPYPPLYFFETALGIKLLGADIRAGRLASLVNILLSAAIVFGYCRKKRNSFLSASFLALLTFVFSVWGTGSASIAICDPLVLLLSIIAVIVWLEAFKRDTILFWVIAGAITAFPPLAKQTALAVPFAIGLYMLIFRRASFIPFAAGSAGTFILFYGFIIALWGIDSFTQVWLETANDPKLESLLPARTFRAVYTFLPFFLLFAVWFFKKGKVLLREPLPFFCIASFVILIPSQITQDPSTYYFAPMLAGFLLWSSSIVNLPSAGPWIKAVMLVQPAVLLAMGNIFPLAPTACDYEKGEAMTEYLEGFKGQEIVTGRHIIWSLRHNGEVSYDMSRLYDQWTRKLPHPWDRYVEDLEERRFGLIATSNMYEREPAKSALERNYRKVGEITHGKSCRYWYKFEMFVPKQNSSLSTEAMP